MKSIQLEINLNTSRRLTDRHLMNRYIYFFFNKLDKIVKKANKMENILFIDFFPLYL